MSSARDCAGAGFAYVGGLVLSRDLMASVVPSNPDFWHRYGTAVIGVALTLVALLVVAGMLWNRHPESALVIATTGDCRRAVVRHTNLNV